MLKKWKLFLETLNTTTKRVDSYLDKHFDLTSDEIQSWCQDFLDEYPELEFEVDKTDADNFTIYFSTGDSTNTRGSEDILDEKKYPFPKETLELLKTKLKYHGFIIDNKHYAYRNGIIPIHSSTNDTGVYYGVNKKFIFINFKRIKPITESKNLTDKKSEANLQKYFGITTNDIKDWIQDFLDNYPELDFEISAPDKDMFSINFYILDEDKNFLNIIRKNDYLSKFKSESLDLLQTCLKQHNCTIWRSHSNNYTFYLDISKDKPINESKNQTNPNYEEGLEKHFQLSSDEIQNWCQDFLDEYAELSFEISVANHNYFTIYFFLDQMYGNITKEKYLFPDDILNFLKERLNAHHCYIEEDKIHYRSKYIFINIRKYR